jgi:hypothetical protein
MKKMVFSTILASLICFWSMLVCSASDSKIVSDKGILLAVVDSSNETYGAELKNKVFTQLSSQLKCSMLEENDGIEKAEQPRLLELANKEGSKQVMVIEILPAKSDVDEILYYRAIKSEATLKVRLYDAEKKQYILNEAVSCAYNNQTFIPFTDVGKKCSVLKSVGKATDVVLQKVNHNVEESNKAADVVVQKVNQDTKESNQ